MQRRARKSALVLATALLLASVPTAAEPQRDVLVGSYTYGWMGADLGVACGQSVPAVLTRVRLGTASFEADGTVYLDLEERVSCPLGAIEDWRRSFAGVYVLDGDRLVLDLDPFAPGTSTWTFHLSWDRAIGTFVHDDEMHAGFPGIGVLVRNGSGLDESDLLGDYTIARMRQSQVDGGIEARASFGTLSFLPGGQYTQTVDQMTIGPYGSAGQNDWTVSGTCALEPDGVLRLDGGLHVGAVSPDGSFGVLIRRAAFGSMFAVFARVPEEEPTPRALDDLWYLAFYGAGREADPVAEVVPSSESGLLAFDAQSGRVLAGHTEVQASLAGGAARDGFSFFPFARVGPGGAYELAVDDGTRVPLRLGRHEDVLIFAEVASPESVLIGLAPRAWGPLVGDVRELAVPAGGVHTLTLRAGAAHRGMPYLILGSVSGTYPGMPVGDLVLPLNKDGYTVRTLTHPDPPLAGAVGFLDELGAASAAFTLPPGGWPFLAGRTVHHACVVFDPSRNGEVVLVSNPVPLVLGN